MVFSLLKAEERRHTWLSPSKLIQSQCVFGHGQVGLSASIDPGDLQCVLWEHFSPFYDPQI